MSRNPPVCGRSTGGARGCRVLAGDNRGIGSWLKVTAGGGSAARGGRCRWRRAGAGCRCRRGAGAGAGGGAGGPARDAGADGGLEEVLEGRHGMLDVEDVEPVQQQQDDGALGED